MKTETRALKKLAKRVKQLRLWKRWTQEECAEHAAVAPNYLSGVERGVRNPTVRVLSRLAAAFGVGIAELFREES